MDQNLGWYNNKSADNIDIFEPNLRSEELGPTGVNLTPQEILARSIVSNINSPSFSLVSRNSVGVCDLTPENVSGVYGGTGVENSDPEVANLKNVVPSPHQILSQISTPQGSNREAYEDKTSMAQPASGGAGNRPFFDRATMYAAMQQHQIQQQQQEQQKDQQNHHQQHQKLQNLSQVQQITQESSECNNIQPPAMLQMKQQQQRASIQHQKEQPFASGRSVQDPAVQVNNQRQLLQNLDPELQKRVSQEINAKQYELFVKSYIEHCKRKNIAFNPNPEICGIRINIFILYMLVQRMGGAENVTKIQQWPILARKLHIYASNGSNELSTYYYKALAEYEKYFLTSEGIKETQAKRLILQRSLQDTLKNLQDQMQSKNFSLTTQHLPMHHIQQVPPAQSEMQQIALPKSQQAQGKQTPVVQQLLPQYKYQVINDSQKMKQQMNMNVETQVNTKQRKSRTKKGTKKKLDEEKRQLDEARRLREIQLDKQKLVLEGHLREQQEFQRRKLEEQIRKIPKLYKRSFARNYLPVKRPIETQGGYDIKALAQIGDKIDAIKPIFLFAPELGTVNLHAITMALQSENNAEINTALNTLLVISADHMFTIPLNDIPELLDSLCILACEKLNKLQKSNFSRKTAISGVLKEYDVEEMLSKPFVAPNQTNQRMDQSLNDYIKKENNDLNDVIINVDSLTGIDIEQIPVVPNKIPLDIGPDEDDLTPVKLDLSVTKRWDYLPEPLRFQGFKREDELSVTSYIASLKMVKDDFNNFFSELYKSGSEDPHILFQDQLSTISMILRNISFNESNAKIMAKNCHMNRYIFELLWALFTQKKKFLFNRTVLNFKKDTIILLTNISHLIKLENVLDACLLLFLTFSFGEPKVTNNQELNLSFPEHAIEVEKYREYGVDIIAKIMSLGYPNREYIKSVLLADFEEDTPDSKICLQLLRRYNSSQKFKLLNDIFSFVSLTIPFRQLNQMSNIIEESIPIIFQATTTALCLIKLIDTSPESPFVEHNLPYYWLTSEESLGPNLVRLSEILSTIASQNISLKHLRTTLSLLSPRCLELARLLFEKAFQLSSNQKSSEKKLALCESLLGIPNFFPNDSTFIKILMNPHSDSYMAKEMEQFYLLRKEISYKLITG